MILYQWIRLLEDIKSMKIPVNVETPLSGEVDHENFMLQWSIKKSEQGNEFNKENRR
jgi:hypothetical protein